MTQTKTAKVVKELNHRQVLIHLSEGVSYREDSHTTALAGMGYTLEG